LLWKIFLECITIFLNPVFNVLVDSMIAHNVFVANKPALVVQEVIYTSYNFLPLWLALVVLTASILAIKVYY